MEEFYYKTYMKSLDDMKRAEEKFEFNTSDVVSDEYTYNLKSLKKELKRVPTLIQEEVKVSLNRNRIEIEIKAIICFDYDISEEYGWDEEYSSAIYEAKTEIENVLYEWSRNENNFSKKNENI